MLEDSNTEKLTENQQSCIVYGRNSVMEVLRSDRDIDKVFVKKGNREGSIKLIVAEAINKKIPVIEVAKEKLDFLSNNSNHQGILAYVSEKKYCDIDDILNLAHSRGEKPLIVVLDSIEDPHNMGAIIRCAECSGAHGIIIPKRRSVGINSIVSKASAGALEHMLISKVSNIANAIEKLKENGMWIFASEAGGTPYYETDFNCGACIVLGSEGKGISKIVKDNSDYIVSIPMYGQVNSLNVSTAASVILCHAARMQRT